MTWRNVKLIYLREIRDQLRDRRTLFMIAVLPLLLYPLLGMSILQLSQFRRQSEPTVLVVGSEQLLESTEVSPLFENGRFAADLFDDPKGADHIKLEFVDRTSRSSDEPAEVTSPSSGSLEDAQKRLQSGDVQVVVYFPEDFGERLSELRARVGQVPVGDDTGTAPAQEASAVDIPQPEILFNSAREKSRVAQVQIDQILNVWKSQIVRENLMAGRVPANIARPFAFVPRDIAERRQQEAALWAKILPFVLFIWALTGAFYPAVDLCAGEKERGTLETLLSSPALRTEIVWGKLLTVMTFSCATALLNLGSMGFTAQYTLSQLKAAGPEEAIVGLDLPALGTLLWLLVALLPVSALFSALCLACAAFARSTKEGQYYLMPLLLVTMPLMMLPMAPGAELDLGSSLIPVSGLVLLLKGLVQGNYAEVAPYAIPVVLVTLACCLLAIRWAVYQFSQESVLFRESERFDLRRWVVHLVRDRQETPTLGAAVFCFALICVVQFFIRLAMSGNVPPDAGFRHLSVIILISQIVCIVLPALLMTLFFTSRPWRTLLLDRWPGFTVLASGVLLAIVCHPLGHGLATAVQQLYPLSDEMAESSHQIVAMLEQAPNIWLPLLLIAVLPAICEELAFRGFILSGLRHLGHKWWAIALSAIFFGMAHPVIQQSIGAAAVGLIIGYLAVQTGSLLPCILFHMTYNGLMLLSTQWLGYLERSPTLGMLSREVEPGQFTYHWGLLVVCAAMGMALLAWLHRLPYQATREERISDARARQGEIAIAGSLAGNAESNAS